MHGGYLWDLDLQAEEEEIQDAEWELVKDDPERRESLETHREELAAFDQLLALPA